MGKIQAKHMNLLRGQEQISMKRTMPVNDTNFSGTVGPAPFTTVQLYYYNAGVRTTDAGQAIGVVVDAVLPHKNILNALGTNVASKNDTSLTFTCTALTTELEWAARPDIQAIMEGNDNSTLSIRAAQVGALLANGEYIVDYRSGLLIGKKASTAATMTSVSYNISVPASTAGGMITQNFDYISDAWNAGTFTDTFVYRKGGSTGTIVGTMVVVYTDATKGQLVDVTYT
jgi:hypothetical protein